MRSPFEERLFFSVFFALPLNVDGVKMYQIPLEVISASIGQTIGTETVNINPLIFHDLGEFILN